ncbi:MAG: hypothetical protein FRX49_06119 [Trebouxia sp. A1-2]|nr:MAG: hypothetical protein FRX49_06119 [Trebouxia sp. A1-2]
MALAWQLLIGIDHKQQLAFCRTPPASKVRKIFLMAGMAPQWHSRPQLFESLIHELHLLTCGEEHNDLGAQRVGKTTGRLTGIKNAKVFPEPVLAAPKISLPHKACGKDARCIAVSWVNLD